MQSQFGILLNVAEPGTARLGAAPRDLFLGVYRQGRSVSHDTIDARPRPLANRKGVDEFAVGVADDSSFIFTVGGRVLLKHPGQRARCLPISAGQPLALSGDGRTIVSCSSETDGAGVVREILSRVDAATGERTALLRSSIDHVAFFVICPCGKRMLVGLEDPFAEDKNFEADLIWSLDLNSGTSAPFFHEQGPGMPTWRGEALRMGQPAFSPDGQKLAFVEPTSGHVFVRDLTTTISTRLNRPPTEGGGEERAAFPQFTPDGSRVLFCQGGHLWASSVRGGRPQLVFGDARRRLMQAFPLGISTQLEVMRSYTTMNRPLTVPPGFVRRELGRKSLL